MRLERALPMLSWSQLRGIVQAVRSGFAWMAKVREEDEPVPSPDQEEREKDKRGRDCWSGRRRICPSISVGRRRRCIGGWPGSSTGWLRAAGRSAAGGSVVAKPAFRRVGPGGGVLGLGGLCNIPPASWCKVTTRGCGATFHACTTSARRPRRNGGQHLQRRCTRLAGVAGWLDLVVAYRVGWTGTRML